MSKKGLGRGLQALISDEFNENPVIKEIPISDIEPNPDQPRREFEAQALNELADSIREHGLLQPILVRPSGDRYMIIAGERRLRAAKLAGLNQIECIVQFCNDQQMAERAIVENIQRANLSPYEEGMAYHRLIDEYGLTQDQVAQKVGKARTTIANLLRIIQLPDIILQMLKEEKLSLGHAKVLLGIKDSSLQVIAAEKAVREQLSVRETEELINRLMNPNEKIKQTPAKATPPVLNNVEDRLRASFQTKVHLKGNLMRGKIEIQYFSEDELNRLLDLWNIQME
ncbi:ParB-like partition protein [Desulfosporosinus acidiphilus SJ4]|uniref:ParB-like partition protein n=1 Tax=Desulfosporosinus acidiphilus (strain DSM 22704 / JCM 16185 / SJ4) TaxID=646529 RepID=I4DCL9_DESAJ|nr:ParB/RepB/Spo0J family partition protein [Desulfosporosinus acidiphilus]AFM43543.1 ParB-like partition protein [Desulfosporosinus acidiphilus SJ4]